MPTNLEFQQPISGTINGSGQSIDLTSPNGSTQTVGVTGTWVGTLVIEGSNDGTNYYSCSILNKTTDLVVATITANGIYDTNTNAFQFFRARSSAWTSGTVTLAVYGADAPSFIFTESALKGGTDGTTIGNTADSLKVTASQSGAWTVTAAEDKNYGTVGANTMRAAAQIGNAAGAADFNAGNSSAQTLRVVIASNQVVIPVGGNVASAATDSGNPVKIGATFFTTQPTVTNGQRVNLQATNRGALIVSTGVDAFNINNITGTVSLPTGAATSALQTTGNASLASIDSKLTSPLAVTGPLTDAQLRATPVPVSGSVSVSNFPATQSVTQGTSPWVVSGTVTSAEDKNYGIVGASTLRTAAQIGNATGAADFNAGTTGAQTLRVVLPTDQTAIPASQSGAWTVAATQSGTWNIGTLTSITNPVAVTGTFWPATQPVSGTVAVTQSTSPWVVSGTVTSAEDKNYGTVGATTLRTAAQIGNATGAADFNAGATGAQTLRTVANQGSPNTAANGWFNKITDGVDTALVTTAGDLQTSDGLSNGGLQGALTLTTGGTTYEAKVGASRLSNRKNLTITALDDMYWGYSNTVTTASGSPLYKNQVIIFDINPDSSFQVWLVAAANGKNARITESL